MNFLEMDVTRVGFVRLLMVNALLLAVLAGCAGHSKQLQRDDVCLLDEQGPANDRAVFICVLFEENRDGHLCPVDALYKGASTKVPANRPSIKQGSGPQKLAWQAVTWDADAGEHKVADVLFKVAFDPFTGTPIKVPPGAGAEPGLARMAQPLGDCENYAGACIADPGRGSPTDANYREPVPVEYKYSVQKWKKSRGPIVIDVDCPPLDPVFRVNF